MATSEWFEKPCNPTESSLLNLITIFIHHKIRFTIIYQSSNLVLFQSSYSRSWYHVEHQRLEILNKEPALFSRSINFFVMPSISYAAEPLTHFSILNHGNISLSILKTLCTFQLYPPPKMCFLPSEPTTDHKTRGIREKLLNPKVLGSILGSILR